MTKAGSYLKVNYALRPGKNIERKMIAEALMRLSVFRRVKTYRYIGLGSTFYSDFTLFHRLLGLSPMFSMQKHLGDDDRFDFNLPLRCTKNKFGKSTDVLPEFTWEGIPTIVWLDYDDKLDKSMLDDVGFLTSVLSPSSVLIVTVRSKGVDFGDQTKDRLINLKTSLEDKLPHNVSQSELVNLNFHKVIRRTINANIGDVLTKRNAAVTLNQRIKYEQFLYFTYDDSTPMVTVGGLFIKEKQNKLFSRCDFSSLEFYKSGEFPYNIYAPNLTIREQRHLDKQLPGSRIKSPGVPQEDLEAYGKLYRYFPRFVEAEL